MEKGLKGGSIVCGGSRGAGAPLDPLLALPVKKMDTMLVLISTVWAQRTKRALTHPDRGRPARGRLVGPRRTAHI